MLQQKLLTRIGLLIGLFVVGAVVAIILLQSVIRDIDHVNEDASLLADGVQGLGAAIATIEFERSGTDGQPADLARLDEALATIDSITESVAVHPLMQAPNGAGAAAFASVSEQLAGFTEVARETNGHTPGPEFLAESVALRRDVRELGHIVSRHVADQRSNLGRSIRLLVLGLTLSAIVMVNVSVIVLLRVVHMILRPVDELVAGSRELARERYGHRVKIDQNDEFGELAHAYNRLAEQLGANEERKMETLRQVAVTLNHGLNNAINAIELQLRLLDRDASGNPHHKVRLERIHESLAGMADSVRALANVRRVVLTEYLPGQLMLDLKRSVEGEPDDSPAPEEGQTNPPTVGHAS